MKVELSAKEIAYILNSLVLLEETIKFTRGFVEKGEREKFTNELANKFRLIINDETTNTTKQ